MANKITITMRTIKYIVVHCTATPTDTTIDSMRGYWRNILGWRNPGYHYVVTYKGDIKQLHAEDKVANGVRGYNKHSIHIAYIGGVDEDGRPLDTKSKEQEIAMLKLLLNLRARYPDAIILGHNNFPDVKKACPSFNVADWLRIV